KSLPISFSEFIDSFDNVEMLQADFVDVDLKKDSFDAVFMLTVTEHLTDVKAVLRKVSDVLKPGGKLYLSHGNYYCWNGHHLAPRNVRDYDSGDSRMQSVADWGHVKRLVKNDITGPHVNCLRLHELAELLESLFRIDSWEHHESPEERGG